MLRYVSNYVGKSGPLMAFIDSYSVFVPDFYNLWVSRHNEVQLIVEVEWLDRQVIEVVFNQQRLVGAQVIEEYLRDKANTTITSI